MAHAVPIIDGIMITIKDEAEITVKERKALRDAIIDAQTANYNLSLASKQKVMELEALRTKEIIDYEKRLSTTEKKETDDARKEAAQSLAFRALPQNEQDNLSNFMRVKIRTYLTAWTRGDVPTSDDDFDNLPEVLFDALFDACNKELPQAPDVAETPDNQANPKAITPDSDL